MYHHRFIEQEVIAAAQAFKVVLLLGARQVGKSTLLANLFPQYPVITFNPIEDVQGARNNPKLFLKQFTGPVIFDEIQYAPELLAYLKIAVDSSLHPGQYFLTGSHNLNMLKTVAESMAGRVAIIELSPFTHDERMRAQAHTHWLSHYLDSPTTLPSQVCAPSESLTQWLWRGGFPGLLTIPETQYQRFFKSYLHTYIERDIRSAQEIEGLMSFEHFISLLAALSAQEINYTQLGREIAVAGKTAQRWLELARATYLWRDIPAYTGNTIKRITQKRKGYFIDTGLACFLHRISAPTELLGHPLAGSLFETAISNTIHAVLETISGGARLFHWRTNGGAEVDLVLMRDNKLFPIEIKLKGTLTKHDARGLNAFMQTYAHTTTPVMPGLIIYGGSDCYFLDEHIIALPWNARLTTER